jgi:hypothetical protein
MSKQVRLRRGTSAQHASFTGADGEVTYDTTLKVLRVHDGATPGGKVMRDAVLLNDPAAVQQTVQTGALVLSGQDAFARSLSVTYAAQFSSFVSMLGALTLAAPFRRFPEGLAYAASVALDFATNPLKTITLTGNITFTTANISDGIQVLVRIASDASIRNFTFPGWKFIGSAAPANIAANKTGLLELLAGTSDATILARWSVEP